VLRLTIRRCGFAYLNQGEPQLPSEEEDVNMANKDEMEGRIKEAVGDLTDNKDLQREGKVDQAQGKAKDAIDDASEKAKDLIDRD
jgi:uncharacterized protein YjbJ (UPF0337 family)